MSTITKSSSIDNFFQFNPQTNLWSVFFHDPANLPIEKIKKCFNQFGTIDSIDRFSGIDGKPLCFINFTTEEAVKRCIQQMRSNRFPIHLKRFSFESINSEEAPKSPRRNSRGQMHNNNNNNNRRINGNGGKKKGYEAGPRAKGKYERKGSVISLNSIRASEDEDKSKEDEFTGKSGNDNTSTAESDIQSDLTPKNHEEEILQENLQESTAESQIQSHLSSKKNNKEKILQENLQNSSESSKKLEKASFFGSTNSLRSPKPSELPHLIVRIPIMSPEFYQSPKETIILHVTAHDVIVANIHEACDIKLLQTLFAKYEPLYISRIEMIPRIYIRYCHVYFPDEQTAKSAEKAYDRCIINGTELIVIRAETLATETNSDQ